MSCSTDLAKTSLDWSSLSILTQQPFIVPKKSSPDSTIEQVFEILPYERQQPVYLTQ